MGGPPWLMAGLGKGRGEGVEAYLIRRMTGVDCVGQRSTPKSTLKHCRTDKCQGFN